jgi:phosphoglycerol transferase
MRARFAEHHVLRSAEILPRSPPVEVPRDGDGTNALRARRMTEALLLQAALTVLFLIVVLKLWRTDLRVPMYYWGDTVAQLAVAKSIADGGWIWFLDRLGAPFGFPLVAYPQNLTTTSIVLKALTVLSREPGFLLNIYWLLTIVIASLNAHLALRVMGYSRSSATVFATLYAFLPYAFYRNVAHLPLVYPFIPVLAAFAVQIAANTAASLKGRWGRYVLICAIAQGFDSIYYSFFAVFTFMVAGIIGLSYHRSGRQAKTALMLCAVLAVSSAVNLVPSIVVWAKHSTPFHTTYKTLADSEIYGLKLRQLLSPVQPSRIESIRRFGDKESEFPNENENRSTRLGTILAIGLLGMLAQFLFQQRISPQPRAAAVLTLASILLSTVGGFGAIFNLLVTPDIRAYNRIVVFIAFFIVVYLAHVADAWSARLRANHETTQRWPNAFSGLLLALVLVFGVLDEGQAARPVVGRYANDAAAYERERALVQTIERLHPTGGAIMQLPETVFVGDPGRLRMLPYDHARPYLSSKKLSWSWPAFSYRREAWYASLGDPASRDFVDRLIPWGFVGIWIDRFGYDPSELARIEEALRAALGPPLVGGIDLRYAYFDFLSQRPARGAGPRLKQ